MLGYYFKIAFRSFSSKKFYSFINVMGLCIGMACCLLIFQYVVFEYSFDTFHEKAPNLFRVIRTTIKGGSEPKTSATNGWAAGPTLAQEVPEVVRSVRLHPEEYNVVITNPDRPDKTFEEQWAYYTDATFFQMFSFPLIAGDPAHALSKPGTVVLSQSIARKYFGHEDPIGKTLNAKGWISGTYRVDGIFEDIPTNSHLKFDILLPMVDLLSKSAFSEPKTGWTWHNFITYVQLHEGADLAVVEQKFTDIFMNKMEEDFKPTNTTGYLSLQPLLDIHLNPSISALKAIMGSSQAVYFSAIIGIITLLIAFVNYINLTTARAFDRASEVGVRKVVGAQRRQLIFQFLAESALTILIAFALALALASAFKPSVNNLNSIMKGENYGWPIVSGMHQDERFVKPLVEWTPAIAPFGLGIVTNKKSSWYGNLLAGALRGQHLRRIILGHQDSSAMIVKEDYCLKRSLAGSDWLRKDRMAASTSQPATSTLPANLSVG